MSQSEIHTDTDRLKEIVANLPVFGNDLKIGFHEIMSAFQRLGNTWKDDEYERFKKCMEPLRKTIDEMTHELSRQQNQLQGDLDNLIRLRQINQ